MLTCTPQPNNTPPIANVRNRKRSLVLTARNADGTPLRKMCTFTREGRQFEKQLNQSGYDEPLLDPEELCNSDDDENQGHPHREYSTTGASNYSVGRELLIKLKLSPFGQEILNHLMPRIKMSSCK